MFGAKKTEVWTRLIALNQGLCVFNEGRLFEARRLCASARDFFSRSTMRSKAVLAELLLARIALRLNDSPAARQHCDSVLQQLKELGRPVLACQAEFLSGKIEQAAVRDERAYEAYCRPRSLLEMLRGNLRGEELKIAFFNDNLDVYETLIT